MPSKKKKTCGRFRGMKNPAGNLVLHIIGGTNYLIGTVLGHTGYVRDRELEFNRKGVEKTELVAELKKLIQTSSTTLNGLKQEDMDAAYPIFFDKPGTSIGYVLTQLLLHLNYHLGQVNYFRRMLE